MNTYPSTVGSVRILLDGTTRTDGARPYAVGGEDNGVYQPLPLSMGIHVLSATSFSSSNGNGLGGVPLTIRFTVQ